MGDKIAATRSTARAARIDDPEWLGAEAKRMAKALLNAEKHGIGDTIVNAAFRIGAEHKIDPQIILQGHQREPRTWLVPRWMALFRVYHERFSRGAARLSVYEEHRHEAEKSGVHPALLRLADLVAGHHDDPEDQR